MLNRFAIYGIVIAGVIIAFGAATSYAYFSGRSAMKKELATETLAATVKVLKDRKQIDETITTSDAGALCADMGLSDDDTAQCVQRLLEADPVPGDKRADPQEGSPVRQPGGVP
jgi:hypothetical protein